MEFMTSIQNVQAISYIFIVATTVNQQMFIHVNTHTHDSTRVYLKSVKELPSPIKKLSLLEESGSMPVGSER